MCELSGTTKWWKLKDFQILKTRSEGKRLIVQVGTREIRVKKKSQTEKSISVLRPQISVETWKESKHHHHQQQQNAKFSKVSAPGANIFVKLVVAMLEYPTI